MLADQTNQSIQALTEPWENSSGGEHFVSPAEYSQISAPVTVAQCPAAAVTISPLQSPGAPVNNSPPAAVAVEEKAVTLADVLALVEQRADLKPNRKRELHSAVVRFSKLLREDPAHIPLNIPFLREQLAAINPIAKGISRKSLQNIRSGLLSAIHASGLKPGILHDGKSHQTEPWKKLATNLSKRRHLIGIRRLAGFCSRNGVEPHGVDDGVVAALMAEMSDTSFVPKQHQLHRKTAIIWNEVVALLSDLRLRPVTVPPSRRFILT